MRSAAWLAEYAGIALLVLTTVSAAAAALKRRGAHRFDILAFVLSITLPPFVPNATRIGWAVQILLNLAAPFLLLRLVRHFREVSAALLNGAFAAALIGTVVLSVSWGSESWARNLGVAAYLIAILGYIVIVFVAEARRTAGVTARRLAFAAAGVSLTAMFWVIFGLIAILRRQAIPSAPVIAILRAVSFACYFLAFSTPRRLRAIWQRTELARYLSETAERDAEERGWHAAADLAQAANRSVGHSLIFVALRPSPESAALVVRAATDARWIGTTAALGAGVLGRVTQSRLAEMARPSDVAPDVGDRLAALGNRVLVAPISTSVHVWGVVLVVQRRGSLFPEDDLVLLAQLGRYAATALDHAALVADARDRERRRADVRLHAAEARMALMLDSIKDYAMFVLDADARVVAWHVGAQHVFGYQSDDMTGESAARLYNLSAAQFLARLDEARLLGRAIWEGPCRRQNGDRFVGATVLRPLAGDSDLIGFVAVTRDVTEQRDLEDRLRQSQKMEAIGQLAGGIAHDFNNMLLAILGNADLLEADAGGDLERLELIGQIQNSVQRAEALTRRLLAFGRRQVLQPTVVSLSSLVTDLLPMLRRVIAEHIEVVPDTSRPARAVMGDRSQLEQVLVNLAVNARDAMPHGGQLTIRTDTEWLDEARTGGEVPVGSYAVLEVTDTGIGMDEATRERIFEPFFTTKGFGYGTGLGLATVYGNVKQMGGLIRVESQPGEGARFRIYLPETEQRATPSVPATPQALPRGHETILLVEDDTAVRAFLVRTLERQGYRVMSAEHPSAALALASSHEGPLHLVITDVVLPGLVGPEFVRALAESRAGQPPVPVLYISGYADGSPVWQGAVPKASHFLQKPFAAGDLLTRIRQILAPDESPGSHAV